METLANEKKYLHIAIKSLSLRPFLKENLKKTPTSGRDKQGRKIIDCNTVVLTSLMFDWRWKGKMVWNTFEFYSRCRLSALA